MVILLCVARTSKMKIQQIKAIRSDIITFYVTVYMTIAVLPFFSSPGL